MNTYPNMRPFVLFFFLMNVLSLTAVAGERSYSIHDGHIHYDQDVWETLPPTDAVRMLKQQNIRPRPQNYILQPWRQFWWRYVTLYGYRDGWHGLKLSLYMAYYEWVKYRKLAALWRNPL